MEQKQKYNVLAVLKRMLAHMWQQDGKQYGRIAFYTVVAAIYPFMAVILPKLAIGILEQGGEDAVKNLVITMAGYLVVAGALAMLMNYFKGYIETRNMRIRILYLADMSKQLQRMDYCHHEDASLKNMIRH